MNNSLLGLYRDYEGNYIFVQNMVTHADGDLYCVYFDVMHPEKGFMCRPAYEWFDTLIELPSGFSVPIEKVAQNVTGQKHRYEKIVDLDDNVKNLSTEQLIKELGSRNDSPFQHTDIEGLNEKVLDYDYIIGFPTYVEDEGKEVFSVLYADDNLDRVKRYFSTHKFIDMAKIYKRTCMEVDV